MAPTSERQPASAGPRLSHPPRGEEVLISGIAGYFPDSDCVHHLQENLFNKVDLTSSDTRRWNIKHREIPARNGKINHLDKFDADFFGVHYKEAHTMDPMGRILLEKTCEAIIDAGVNPQELKGQKVGVFLGCCYSESERTWVYDKMQINNFGVVGCSRSMMAHRLSQWLGVTGPSFTADSACSSSLTALDCAFRAIREGHCDSAIVGGANLCLHPHISLLFYRLGVLSPDGWCKSFDETANGYTRSEAIVVFYLQKAKDSRRVYAQIVYSKTNCDGYKEHGITHPCGDMQKILLQEFYEECAVPPESVEFIEAHGTGTKVGDPEELRAIDDVFCKGRDSPLMIGSIKSNLGHSEAVSGLCGLSKMCIAYSSGFIAPNLHFVTPRREVEALTSGRLQVVTEKQAWNRGFSAVSSFGFGGANVHVLLKNFARAKVNGGQPLDSLPRLVCASGRTESAVAKIFDDLESRALDAEHARLWHAVHARDIPGHGFRGYAILQSTPSRAQCVARSVSRAGAPRPLWLVFVDAPAHCATHAAQLMDIPVFAAMIQKCHEALAPLGVDLVKSILEPDSRAPASAAHAAAAAVATQVALVDLLRVVGIRPDHVIGHGVGELVCAYADSRLSAEQAVLAAYYHGYATAGISTDILSSEVTTKEESVNFFKKINYDTTARSKRWVTSSQQFWDLSSADYHEKNLTGRALFEEAVQKIPTSAVIVKVMAPELTSGSPARVSEIALMRPGKPAVLTLLTALGQLFEAGYNPQLAELYPPVTLPVSVETPKMAHLVEWDHSENWSVAKYKVQDALKSTERTVSISIDDDISEYLAGHVVDGRNIIPATSYLVMVWETLGMILDTYYPQLSVVFENIQFLRATTIPKSGQLEFTIAIQASGNFEVVESGTSIVRGRILAQKGVGQTYRKLPTSGASVTPGQVILRAKDFYRELRLRGYEYRDAFRSVTACNVTGTCGQLAWCNNWATFMDSMLQLQLLNTDTRALAVPTRIDRLAIDTDIHYRAVMALNATLDPPTLLARVYPYAGIIRSGGIELSGLHASTIMKRPPRTSPVLEKNVFVPNYGQYKMKIEDILRVIVHLVTENLRLYKLKIIELVDEEYAKDGLEQLMERIDDCIEEFPLLQSEPLVLHELQLPAQAAVKIKPVTSETNAALFIGANLLSRPDIMLQILSSLKENGFIISREKERPETKAYADKYDIVTTYETDFEYIVLFRKRALFSPAKYIKIAAEDDSYSWIESVKQKIKEGQKIVLYAQDKDDTVNGLLGLVNCLRREPGGEVVFAMLISDPSAPPFDPKLQFYVEQLEKCLFHNVYQDGQWGAYRYLHLDTPAATLVDHAYVVTETVGDLSSLKWVEGPLKYDSVHSDSDYVLVHVYRTALNFHDVVFATGRVGLESTAGIKQHECTGGLEVAGRTSNGSRVMGVVKRGLSNLTYLPRSQLWPIPDDWTFEEAATVPAVYITVYYALVIRGKMKAGESVLIHAGSGGVGQAAINVALHYGCRVFTTVGSSRKRDFIKKLFPTIQDNQIGNSRNTTFEHMIRRETNGKGVDLVLNCLAEDILLASVRCLAAGGRFLEIGKYDINNNTQVGLLTASKEISFHGIMADNIEHWRPEIKRRVQDLILAGVASGAVRPLTRCSFPREEVEQAYRYMAAGKHVGKILIKIRDEECSNKMVAPTKIQMSATPRYLCGAEEVFVVVGGLGGFGLELADWLVLGGARRLLLSARRGLSNGYQASRLRAWASYGARVQVYTEDPSSEAGCAAMLSAARAMGPVRAVFNLAVVLKDALFQNQTPDTFREAFTPKAQITINLDNLTREMCPELKEFVVFSSVTCGRGNAGQTNYAYANSVVERLCERRRRRGLPALAVQWGPVDDVGLLADRTVEKSKQEFGGMYLQRITSCLQALNKLLRQDATVVSSIVVATKTGSSAGASNPVEAVAQIMGIKDLKTVSYQVSLADMGMDSMMAVEIKQTLEREFEIFLTAQDIRTLTFAKLVELSHHQEGKDFNPATEEASMSALMQNLGDEDLMSVPTVLMPTMVSGGEDDGDGTLRLFLLPGTEGAATALEPLCRGLRVRAVALQLGVARAGEDLPAMVARLSQMVRSSLSAGEPFALLGYSFGTLLALELAATLESEGHKSIVTICVDGSPDHARGMFVSLLGCEIDDTFENSLICQTINMVNPNNASNTLALWDKLSKIKNYDEKIKYAVENTELKDSKYTTKFIYQVGGVMYDRIKALYSYNLDAVKKIQSPIVLLRTKESWRNVPCDEDYSLKKYTHSTVSVHYIEATHDTILKNEECARIINEVLLEKKYLGSEAL